MGGWVGPTAGLDAVVRRKIPSPYRDSNLPIIQDGEYYVMRSFVICTVDQILG
jgi:hypothetical protein